MMPRLLIKTLPALLLAFAVTGCHRAAEPEDEKEAGEAPAVVEVRTVVAAAGTVEAAMRVTGVVRPAPGAELVVVAPEPARVAELPFAPGDAVRRGEVVARFDAPSAAAEVARRQADVVRARAAVDHARAALTRARDLVEKGVAARREAEDASRAAAEADAGLQEAEAALVSANALAARSVVRAPFDGVVTARLHNPGDTVEAASGDAVLRLVDTRRLEVVAQVPAGAGARVARGAAADAVSPGGDGARAALTVAAAPSFGEDGAGSVTVRLSFTGPARLPLGVPVDVTIHGERRVGVLVVPVAAVVHEGEEAAVLVSEGGKAHRVAVQLGLGDGVNVEVRSGLTPGAAVIVDGQAGLPDGAAIHVAVK